VVGVRGLVVEVAGSPHAMPAGARVSIEAAGRLIPVRGHRFSGPNALLMPFAPLEGCPPRLPRRGDHGVGGGATYPGLARPRRQRDGRPDRR